MDSISTHYQQAAQQLGEMNARRLGRLPVLPAPCATTHAMKVGGVDSVQADSHPVAIQGVPIHGHAQAGGKQQI